MKMKSNRILTLVFMGLILALGTACSSSGNSRVVKAVKGPFLVKVHAVGRLKSVDSTYIFCPAVSRIWSYTISYMAPEGKKVKAGQPILRFDAKELNQRLMVKTAEMETAKKELERTRLVEEDKKKDLELSLVDARKEKGKAERKASGPEDLIALKEIQKIRIDFELSKLNEKLAKSKLENQLLSMRTNIRTLEARILRLANEIRDLQTGIAKMNVKAPKDGMVVYASGRRNSKSAVGERAWVGKKIMEMPDLTTMEVAAVIPESMAGKVSQGLDAEIRLDSNPDRVFKGKVKSLGRIFRTKANDQPAIVFDALISIDKPDPELMRPGMAASIDIIISSVADVIQLPESAILYRANGMYVWQKTLFGKKLSAVTVGGLSAGMVEILSGLSEGDRVMILAEEEKGD